MAEPIVGFTSGCFDLLHHSHLVYLQRCRAQCDKLIVGVDSDQMVRSQKGESRPIIPENERHDLINNLGIVSSAFILKEGEKDVITAIKKFRVTKIFKHESFWNMEHIWGLDMPNVQLVIVPDIPGMVSTSQIIARILQRHKSLN